MKGIFNRFKRNPIILSLLVLLLFVACKSPAEPEVPQGPEPNFEYRYNVEVIYTRLPQWRNHDDDWQDANVWIELKLYNPKYESHYDTPFTRVMYMEKISQDKFRCYIPEVFIQTPVHWKKHWVLVCDFASTTEGIYIEGAYEWELATRWRNDDPDGNPMLAYQVDILKFKMSKE